MKLHNIGKKCVKAWGIFLLMALAVGGCKSRNESLTLLNRQSTLGASSCHVTWTGKNVVACSYSSGAMTVFPLDEEGRLEPGTLVPFEGSGPDSTRQERSHIHSSQLSPDGRFLFVIDLGADYIYRFPVEDGIITCLEPYKIKVPAGQGPRHFDFSKDGRFLYLITELEGYVIVYDYNGGDLRQIQMIEADPLHARGSADIHFSPDGKFLYASNRLKGDGLAIFSQDPQTGLLQDTGQDIHVPHPVFVTLTPTAMERHRPAHPLPAGNPRAAGIRALTQRKPPASRREDGTAPEPALVLAVEAGFAESAANAYL